MSSPNLMIKFIDMAIKRCKESNKKPTKILMNADYKKAYDQLFFDHIADQLAESDRIQIQNVTVKEIYGLPILISKNVKTFKVV